MKSIHHEVIRFTVDSYVTIGEGAKMLGISMVSAGEEEGLGALLSGNVNRSLRSMDPQHTATFG
ncbi:MAG: hypothetical protein ACYCXT_06250 [Acidiferrobacteraceae bacterium]